MTGGGGGLFLQVYPTVVRALGLGCCSAVARIGAMITPFVAQVCSEQFAVQSLIVSLVRFPFFVNKNRMRALSMK